MIRCCYKHYAQSQTFVPEVTGQNFIIIQRNEKHSFMSLVIPSNKGIPSYEAVSKIRWLSDGSLTSDPTLYREAE